MGQHLIWVCERDEPLFAQFQTLARLRGGHGGLFSFLADRVLRRWIAREDAKARKRIGLPEIKDQWHGEAMDAKDGVNR